MNNLEIKFTKKNIKKFVKANIDDASFDESAINALQDLISRHASFLGIDTIKKLILIIMCDAASENKKVNSNFIYNAHNKLQTLIEDNKLHTIKVIDRVFTSKKLEVKGQIGVVILKSGIDKFVSEVFGDDLILTKEASDALKKRVSIQHYGINILTSRLILILDMALEKSDKTRSNKKIVSVELLKDAYDHFDKISNKTIIKNQMKSL